VLRWSADQWREAEAARDDILQGVGTTEPWHQETGTPVFASYAVSVQWRRPLRVDEVNLMRETPEVKQRKGRP
jgi:hypothetical protein